MRRAERLFRRVMLLRSRRVMRAEDLARGLEVSLRTVYRDIAHLQGSGLPIDGAAGVGYLLRPGFDLPGLTLTHDQIDALVLALALAERQGDPALVEATREVRAKLQASLPEAGAAALVAAPFFARAAGPRAPACAALLRRAIRRRQVVAVDYTDAAGQTTRRALHPLALWAMAEGWLLSAWCELRGDFRSFRLDRIGGAEATGAVFPDDPARGLLALLARERALGPPACAIPADPYLPGAIR
jgi:predicted DNA-binding transcriptional regulator YafY